LCKVCVVKGEGLLRYSFPPPHPFNSSRPKRFWEKLEERGVAREYVSPEKADEEVLELFHEKSHVEFVRKASHLGYGYLDQGDTPAFLGALEAGEFAVGSTLACVERVLAGKADHGFNPVGGLHHARPNASAGFCIFNDIGVAIELLRKEGIKRILYVDVDVHHGDGVYYPYETDPDVFVFDIHEDGRFIYPGTGSADETGSGKAEGTKLNIPLGPGEGDKRIAELASKLEGFARRARPEFIILQAGADSMAGDPIGGLAFSEKLHSAVAKVLHEASHESSDGRLVSMGGGGYDVDNCADAWISVVRQLDLNLTS
jgi:acetoin utilization protein AcuC